MQPKKETFDDDEKEQFLVRAYQADILATAIQKNQIVFLPTGSGKTYIAVLLIRELCHELLESNNSGNGTKKTMVLANTVSLANQLCKTMRRHLDLNVGIITGEMNVDVWSEDQWRERLQEQHVLVLTSQIFLDVINHGYFDLARVNLLILDECHRAVNDHPMRMIMQQFRRLDVCKQPRVLGLTATLLNGNCKTDSVEKEVRELEKTLHSTVATVQEMAEVLGYASNPYEKIVAYDSCSESALPTDCYDVMDRLKDLINEVPEASSIKLHLENLRLHLNMLGAFGGYRAALFFCIYIERQRRYAANETTDRLMQHVIGQITLVQRILLQYMGLKVGIDVPNADFILKYSSPQVRLLTDLLMLQEDNPCRIVFVERRFTAKVLYDVLQKLHYSGDARFANFECNFLVGFAAGKGMVTRECLYVTKMSKKVIDRFNSGKLNMLVASNVIEEGTDVQRCSTVIKFDAPLDYRSYVQSKGRVRRRGGNYIIMVEASKMDSFHKRYETFKHTEQFLKELLVGKTDSRKSPSESSIRRDLYEDEVLPPYEFAGAEITAVTAISVVNRYCQSLCSDRYAQPAPQWTLLKVGDKYRVEITMPVLCPLRGVISGIECSSKHQAKRAAALEVCRQLHKIGELNDHLLPTSAEDCSESMVDLFSHWPSQTESEDQQNVPKLHAQILPDCLLGGPVCSNKPLYLHLLDFKPLLDESQTASAAFSRLLVDPVSFGLITVRPLPSICDFPLFITQGNVHIKLRPQVAQITLIDEEVSILRRFQHLVFDGVLGLLKEFLAHNNRDDCEALLVVPVRDGTLALDIARKYECLERYSEPGAAEKLSMHIDRETYEGSIVRPWYRSDSPYYLVLRVCDEMTPRSPFPGERDFDSYETYFRNQYGVRLERPDSQPMLLVKALSNRRNCLLPRERTSKKGRDYGALTYEEHLVPEMCIRFSLPASLWYRACLLPSLLHRLTFILRAEQLRSVVCSGIGMKLNKLDSEPPLEADPYEAEPDCENELDTEIAAFEPTTVIVTETSAEPTYPWNEDEEPLDIERHLDQVKQIDIEMYVKFVDVPIIPIEGPIKEEVLLSPPPDFADAEDVPPVKLLEVSGTPHICDMYRVLMTRKAKDIVDMERLETLGDSFLKWAASLYLFDTFPSYQEGRLTGLKGRVVGNKNLYYASILKGLPGYLKTFDFSGADDWKPPGYAVPQSLELLMRRGRIEPTTLFELTLDSAQQISGELDSEMLLRIGQAEIEIGTEDTGSSLHRYLDQHIVRDKTISDSAEALIGVFLLTGGPSAALSVLHWLQVLPSELSAPVCNSLPELLRGKPLPGTERLEARLGYQFRDRALLAQAVTHASVANAFSTSCYQRLEFLGDAALDFLITAHIYEISADLDPGELTDLRSALVNNVTFACLAVRHGFHRYLRAANSELQTVVDRFAAHQESHSHVVDSQVLMLLEEDPNYASEHVYVPKALGDMWEALAGAVFLDSGRDLRVTWRVFYRLMRNEITSFRADVPKNPVRLLHERLPGAVTFHRVRELPDRSSCVTLTLYHDGRAHTVCGVGENKYFAKRAAAKLALRVLQK